MRRNWLIEVRADRSDTSPVVHREYFHGSMAEAEAEARLLAVIGGDLRADATPV